MLTWQPPRRSAARRCSASMASPHAAARSARMLVAPGTRCWMAACQPRPRRRRRCRLKLRPATTRQKSSSCLLMRSMVRGLCIGCCQPVAKLCACLFAAALCSAGAHPCSLAVLAARRACLHAALAAGDVEQACAHGLAVAAASARVYAAGPHPRAALDALTAGSAAAAWAAAGGGAAAAADAKASLEAALALLHVTAGAGGGAHGAAARQLCDSLR